MIRFTYEDSEYRMQFQYDVPVFGDPIPWGPVPSDNTEAGPATKLTLTGPDGLRVAVFVERYYKDNPCLEEARRAAIRKLCKDLSRLLRSSLWRAYLSSHECKKGYKGSSHE